GVRRGGWGGTRRPPARKGGPRRTRPPQQKRAPPPPGQPRRPPAMPRREEDCRARTHTLPPVLRASLAIGRRNRLRQFQRSTTLSLGITLRRRGGRLHRGPGNLGGRAAKSRAVPPSNSSPPPLPPAPPHTTPPHPPPLFPYTSPFRSRTHYRLFCALPLLLAGVTGCANSSAAPPCRSASRFDAEAAGCIEGRVIWAGEPPRVAPYPYQIPPGPRCSR